MSEFFRTGSYLRITSAFVDQVIRKYHYNENDANLLKCVAKDIRSCIKDQEGLEITYVLEEEHKYADVAFSLGTKVDILIERYAKKEQVLEQLAMEHLISELMMEEYAAIAEQIEKKSGYFIGQFHFWGSDNKYPITKLKEQVRKLQSLKLECTEDYNLRPAKSVVFRVDLSKEPYQNHRLGICEGCMLGQAGKCANYNG